MFLPASNLTITFLPLSFVSRRSRRLKKALMPKKGKVRQPFTKYDDLPSNQLLLKNIGQNINSRIPHDPMYQTMLWHHVISAL